MLDKRITIVIPTYWCSSHCSYENTASVFDHPTPLDEEGTFLRTLKSLEGIAHRDFDLVLVVATTQSEIQVSATEKIRSLLKADKSDLDVKIIDDSRLQEIKDDLKEKSVPSSIFRFLNLENYAAIRNICLIAGIMNRSDISIFLDDDEVIEDRDFIDKVYEDINEKDIQALAGYYLQPDGDYLLDPKKVPGWKKTYWNNLEAMNDAFNDVIGDNPGLKKTPFVFGGNMSLTKEVMSDIPFDPMITRGEDIDYLINCRINGIYFFLDSKLSIRHLPPPKKAPLWLSFREDIKRFLYERKKIRDHSHLKGLSQKDLMPYPGIFLGDDLEERILAANQKLKSQYKKKGDHTGIRECDRNISIVDKNPYKDFDTSKWLKDLKHDWQSLTAVLEGYGL